MTSFILNVKLLQCGQQKKHTALYNKGCLWLTCGLIVLKMKADNELAISLPVLFKSVKN